MRFTPYLRAAFLAASFSAVASAPAAQNIQTINSGGGTGTTPSGLRVVSVVGEPAIGPGTAVPGAQFVGAGFAYLLALPFSPGLIDEFTTSAGWSTFPGPVAGLSDSTFDAGSSSFRGTVSAAPVGTVRVAGWKSDNPAWLPYGSVGPNNYVRAKYSVYAVGQANPAALNQVPNMRLRVASRFAVTSMLEVLHHSNGDPATEAVGRDFAPSRDPANPSVYRVDYDPPEVPRLVDNPTAEGMLRAFEAYATDPQDNGSIALTESALGTYPRLPDPDEAPATVVKTYTAAAGDFNAAQFSVAKVYFAPSGVAVETTGVQPLAFIATSGTLVLDTTAIPGNRIGIAVADWPGNASDVSNLAGRVRVAEGKQYQIRFHATATVAASNNSQARFRVRTAKFGWVQKLEVGGGHAAGGNNNAIAQAYMPGIGTLNPDQETAGEPGGWYSVLLATPLSRDIRPEFSAGTPILTRMPNLAAEPAAGANVASRRDLRLGADMLDTISTGVGADTETGHLVIDRATVQEFDLQLD